MDSRLIPAEWHRRIQFTPCFPSKRKIVISLSQIDQGLSYTTRVGRVAALLWLSTNTKMNFSFFFFNFPYFLCDFKRDRPKEILFMNYTRMTDSMNDEYRVEFWWFNDRCDLHRWACYVCAILLFILQTFLIPSSGLFWLKVSLRDETLPLFAPLRNSKLDYHPEIDRSFLLSRRDPRVNVLAKK